MANGDMTGWWQLQKKYGAEWQGGGASVTNRPIFAVRTVQSDTRIKIECAAEGHGKIHEVNGQQKITHLVWCVASRALATKLSR